MPTVLAIDAGLGAIKAAAIDDRGWVVPPMERPNDAVRQRGDRSETDTERLWELIRRLVGAVLRELPRGRRIEAVGLCGHGNGLYAIGRRGEPLFGVTSMDSRAEGVVDLWRRDGRAGRIRRMVASHVWAGQPLPILASIGPLPGGGRIGFCKDYVRHRLTGRWVTDRGEAGAAGLLDARTSRWAQEAFALAGAGDLRPMLPELADSFEVSGTVCPTAARQTHLPAGIPVAGGSIDLALGALGDGLPHCPALHVTAGTWAIHQCRTGRSDLPDNILQMVVAPWGGERLLVESSPTSAINLGWLEAMLRPAAGDYRRWDRWVGKGPPDADAPMYLPYPAGAWDLPGARAGIEGLRPGTTAADIVRAVYEGIVLGHRRQIEKFRAAGLRFDRLIVTGGLTRSRAWCQLLADHVQLPVERSKDPHAACRGAAICALHALGRPPRPIPRRGITCRPRRDRRAGCDRRYRRFLQRLDEVKERTRQWT